MYFLHDRLVEHAIGIYRDRNFDDPRVADSYFSTFGPGNIFEIVDRPFERFSDYEELLARLQNEDPVKFANMHKGTAYYFLGWTALDLKNFETGLFYMDAAISEDIKNWQIGLTVQLAYF